MRFFIKQWFKIAVEVIQIYIQVTKYLLRFLQFPITYYKKFYYTSKLFNKKKLSKKPALKGVLLLSSNIQVKIINFLKTVNNTISSINSPLFNFSPVFYRYVYVKKNIFNKTYKLFSISLLLLVMGSLSFLFLIFFTVKYTYYRFTAVVNAIKDFSTSLLKIFKHLLFFSFSNFVKKHTSIRYGFVIKTSFCGILFFIGLLTSTLFYYTYIYTLPNVKNLQNYRPKQTSYFYDKNGGLLYKTYADENRTLVNLKNLHPHTINAIISIEDADFYNHRGVSIPSIIRAAYANYKSNHVVQGGSTITQQLVKNTLIGNEQSLERKIKEAILALLVEQNYTKDEILEIYLNTVSFGGTAYGIEEASLTYFGKNSTKLNLAESALLAGLPAAPSEYSPYIDQKKAKIRQLMVLNSMYEQGYISSVEKKQAFEYKLDIKYPITVKKYPHFVDYVYYYLSQKFGENAVQSGGFKVYTSIDPAITTMAQNIVLNSVDSIKYLNVSNGAALVIKNNTGEVIAMVGSKDFYSKDIDGFVNITTSLRQPGSSIKPFVYSLALQNGQTAATLINDSPVTYKTYGSPNYSPKNYDGKFRGMVTLRRALANSLNIPAVKTLEKNGVTNFIEYVKNFGINTWTNNYYGLSLALGSAEVKMTELANAYTVFANNGVLIPINPVLYIENSNGDIIDYNPCIFNKSFFVNKRVIAPNSPCGKRVISTGNAFIINSILSDFNARSEAFGVSVLNVPGTAVKTGTTDDLKDNWAFGFNRDYTVGTWVGNNDNSPMSRIASGITGASPIWADIIKNLTNEQNRLIISKEVAPSDIVYLPICNITDTLACNNCNTGFEFFIRGTEPKKSCRDNDSLDKLIKEYNRKKKKID